MTDVKRGKVILKTFSPASKSRHEAVYLVSGGEEYVLRRKGDNPFMDNPLAKLAGKEIEVKGRISDYIFWVESWEEIGE